MTPEPPAKPSGPPGAEGETLYLSVREGSVVDLQAAAEAAAAALATRWQELGFDGSALEDPDATIRASGGGLPASALFGSELPRISVDLPGTEPSPGPSTPAPPSGRPDLEVRGVLGEGGMGRVLLARQRSLGREVALKTLREAAAPHHREALLAEGAITGSLEHPAIVPVHALGLHADGRPVLVMKRVDGVAWQELLRNPAHPAWEGWSGDARDRLEGHLEILMQVCNAAHFAHSRGIVHRDIKPQNVLIGRFGDVYLADWGVARRMVPGPVDQVCGTPGYMAPEMASGGVVDARTDVYLLGSVLHEVLTGRRRHEAPTPDEAMRRAAVSAPFAYPPSVPEDLAELANRATARDRAARPASAAAFRAALADHLRHRSSIALATTAVPRVARLRRMAREAEGAEDEETHREMDRLAAEAHFALSQALEQWGENPSARRTLDELEEFLALRRARAAELERLARDLDPEVSSRQRTLALAGLAAAAILAPLPALARGIRHQPGPRELFLVSFVPLAVVLATLAALRRPLARSAVNRRTAVSILTMVAGVSVSRGLGLKAGLGVPAMLAHDSVIGAVLAVYSSAVLLPQAGWVALVMLGSAVTCALAPAYAHFAFSVATSASLLVILALARRPWKRAVGPRR